MAVSANYRWVAVGSLTIRNRVGAPANAPEFVLPDLFAAIEDRIDREEQYRYFANDERVMWCDNANEAQEYYEVLIQTGDKNVAGVSFFNFVNKDSRDIEKTDDEGGHYSAHILIKKDAEPDGRHVVLIERVPGIYMTSIKDHFAWVCNDPAYEKQAPDDDGQPRSFRAIFQIEGFQSRTIAEALSEGVLKDIEFVSFEEEFADGHDEEGLIKEVVREARWEVGRQVTEEQATGLFAKAREYMDNLTDDVDASKLFIRIKTEAGQIKRTEIDQANEEVLEQAFIQNEYLSGFDAPLPSRYNGFHDEIVQKMRELGAGAGD